MVCMNVPYSQKSIWTHPIELLDHVCHMESRVNLFGDSVSLGARLVSNVDAPDGTTRLSISFGAR